MWMELAAQDAPLTTTLRTQQHLVERNKFRLVWR
jgi:hypothetical protein